MYTHNARHTHICTYIRTLITHIMLTHTPEIYIHTYSHTHMRTDVLMYTHTVPNTLVKYMCAHTYYDIFSHIYILNKLVVYKCS